jgi:hypothetical protein
MGLHTHKLIGFSGQAPLEPPMTSDIRNTLVPANFVVINAKSGLTAKCTSVRF